MIIRTRETNYESLIWFSMEEVLLVQTSLLVSWSKAINKRLKEPTANEIVLIELAFFEIFFPILKNRYLYIVAIEAEESISCYVVDIIIKNT